MTLIQILIVGFVVLTTHAIEAVTGFGCTVLALPFVTAVLGMQAGVPLLAVLAWALALFIAISKRRSIDFRQYGIIVFFVGLGLPIGMFAFRALDPFVLKKALAVFIVATSAWRLSRNLGMRKNASSNRYGEVCPPPGSTANPGVCPSPPPCPSAPPRALPKYLSYPLLVLGGIVHGAFASGGPLVVLYAATALPDKSRFRATLCLLWATLNTVLIIGYIRSGTFSSDFVLSLSRVTPFLVAGIVIGEKLHDRMDPALFERVVFGTLLATGAIMLAI